MRVLPLLMSLFFGNKSHKYKHVLASLDDMSFVVMSPKGAYAGIANVDVIVLATKILQM